MNVTGRERHGRVGYSIIELLAAIAVLTIGLLGTVQVFQFGLGKIEIAQQGSTGLRAVRNEMEWLRGEPFDSLVPGTREAFASGGDDLDGLPEARPSVVVEEVPEPAGRLKKLTVSLAWTGEHGRTIRKCLTTLVAQREAP